MWSMGCGMRRVRQLGLITATCKSDSPHRVVCLFILSIVHAVERRDIRSAPTSSRRHAALVGTLVTRSGRLWIDWKLTGRVRSRPRHGPSGAGHCADPPPGAAPASDKVFRVPRSASLLNCFDRAQLFRSLLTCFDCAHLFRSLLICFDCARLFRLNLFEVRGLRPRCAHCTRTWNAAANPKTSI